MQNKCYEMVVIKFDFDKNFLKNKNNNETYLTINF